MPGLTPDQVQKIHELLHAKQLIQAVQLYHQATGASLAESKEAVEEMARNELAKPPSGRRNYDNPVLESKIRSLLVKGKKIEAVKIYREEYGIGLKEAKDAVDRIEASMPRDPATALPYESAIGRNPFEDGESPGRRWLTVAAVVVALALCGLGALLFMLNP